MTQLAIAAISLVAAISPPSTCKHHYTISDYKHYVERHDPGGLTETERRRTHRIWRCQRNPRAREYLLGWRRRYERARLDATAPPALASYFDDAGPTASGFHATYGFASLFLRFGTRVRFCYRGCVVGVDEDHGPYVAGRLFDLNVALHNAVGCPDLCWVRWRVLS